MNPGATKSSTISKEGGGSMILREVKVIALLVLLAGGLVYISERSRAQQRAAKPQKTNGFDSRIDHNAQQMLEQGR